MTDHTHDTPHDPSEAEWESLALDELAELAWDPVPGKSLAPAGGERPSWAELVLPGRLRDAVARINPTLPPAAVDEACREALSARSRDGFAENHRLHDLMTRGIRSVVFTDEHGAEHNPIVRLVDFREVDNNDFLVANQVTVVDGDHKRRFDVVLFLNGLPVGLIELKKAGDAYADLQGAHRQVQTYVEELPLAFRANVVCVVSDGISARYGTAFTPFEHFAPWLVDRDGNPVPQPPKSSEDVALTLTLHGLFERSRFVELLHGYVAFAEVPGVGPVKRIAKAHQYFAVEKAVRKTIEATRSDGKAGVVWHTQGSGKSLEMELFAHQIAIHPSLGNPTIVVITDRTDLDDQLFTSFAASELLPEKPAQAVSRDALRTELTNRRTGGIIFTTLQKFGRTREEREAGRHHPLLSDRRNIVVIVDEAHRSHYDSLDGYARHLRDALPHATLIAFTGTPISEADRDTRAVFGDYIDIYDLTRAVDDGATVRVFHESRLIPVDLPEGVDPESIDDRVDQITVGLSDGERKAIEERTAVMNAIYGAPDRLRTLAADVVEHWESRSEQLRKFIDGPGKGMIVCATRDICARLYDEIVALRPDWHSDADDAGRIKVVYTGRPEDEPHIRRHVRRPSQTKVVQNRAKNPDDDLELIIVQSMLLTGFDSPPLHTMYLDKPMRGAALMQALARVNRTFRAKPAGLLVGYAPVTQSLHDALAEYTATDQDSKPVGRDTEEAVRGLRELHGVLCGTILRGYDWRAVLTSGSRTAFTDAVLGTVNYLRDPSLPENQVDPAGPGGPELTLADRFRLAAAKLDRLYALCSTSGNINDLRDDIAFFQAVRVWMAKFDVEDRRSRGLPIPAEVALYLRQLTAGAIEAGGVTDIYEAAGMAQPDLSHLDESYLERLRALKNPNLAIEALRRLIEKQMRAVTKHNVVRQQNFSARLMELMRRYTNQQLTSAEIIAELVKMAKEVNADADRGRRFSPPLSDDELAFYDAVADNESAVVEMGEGQLAAIARDLVASVRRSVTVDWSSRDDVRAKLRSNIRRLLAKHGYPPDAAPGAIDLVLRQMEAFAEEWSPASGD